MLLEVDSGSAYLYFYENLVPKGMLIFTFSSSMWEFLFYHILYPPVLFSIL